MLRVGDDGREDAVGEAPDELSGARIQRVRAAVPLLRVAGRQASAAGTSGEVDEAVHDRRRAVDGRRGGEAPDPVPGRGAEGHEVAVVGPDVDAPLPDGGGGVDVRPGALGPEQAPAGRAEGVERPVGVPDEDPPVSDRRRRIEVLAAAESRKRLRSPAQPSGSRVERVEAPAIGAEVHRAVCERRRAVDLVVGRERPARFPGVDVDRMQLVIPGARVERLADDERRRFEDTGPVAPDDLPRPRRHRRDHPRLAPRAPVAGQRLHPGVVDDPVGDGRRGRRAMVEAALPDDLPGPVVDGVETAPLLSEVETAIGDRRWELEHVARLEHPAQPVGRAELEVRSRVRPLDAEAVRRPREAEDDLSRAWGLGSLGRLRRDELLGGRAALVLDRALLMEPDPDEEAGHDRRHRQTSQQEEAPERHLRSTTTTEESLRPKSSTTNG